MVDNVRKMLPANTAEADIHERATDSSNLIWTDHARNRMEERGITIHDAVRVLRDGLIKGQPRPGKKEGQWVCKMTKRTHGNRDVGVVTIICSGTELIIITVEWEDL
jgi:hypothetical protein